MRRFAFLLLLPALLLQGAEPDEMQRLVRGLGGSDWKERDRCEAKLLEIGLPARPLLESASREGDEELSWRARRILAVITRTRLTLALRTVDGKSAAGLPLSFNLVSTEGSGRPGLESPEGAATDAQGLWKAWDRPGGPFTLEAGSYLLQLAVEGFLPLRIDPLVLTGGERTVSVRLERGIRVSGTLHFSDAKPAAGIAVGLFPCLEPAQIHRFAERSRRREAVTNAEGAFVFEPVPEGEYRLLVEAAGSLHPQILLKRSMILSEEKPPEPLDIILPDNPAGDPGWMREAILSGRCVDSQGRPLSGRLVFFLDGIGGWPEHTGEARADAQGRFQALVPPGRHWLSATLPDSAPSTMGPVCLAPGLNPQVTVVLGKGGVLSGTVVDAAGSPLPQAEIGHYHPGRLEAGTPETSLLMSFRADREGRFSIPHAAPGSWNLRATAEGKGLGTLQHVSLEEGRTLELKLLVPAGIPVEGTVTDQDASPCAGADLTAYPEDFDGRVGEPWDPYLSVTGRSGSAGTFDLVLPFPGRWRVIAEKWGFVAASSDAFLARSGQGVAGLKIRTTRQRLSTLKVLARDAQGLPVPGAQVQILALHPLRPPLPTDPDGIAWVDRLTPGAYGIVASRPGMAPGYARVELGEDEQGQAVCILRPGSRVSGRLLDADGRPLPRHAVLAWRAEFSLRHVEEQAGAESWEVLTDGEGRYVFPHIPQGKLKVMPAPDGKAGAIRILTVPPEDRPVEGVDFRQTDGVPLDVWIKDAHGAVLENACVEAYPSGSLMDPYSVDLYAVGFSDAKGLCRLPGLPPGEKVDLVVGHPERAWAFLKGREVPPLPKEGARPWTLETVLEDGQACEGRLDPARPEYLGPALLDDSFVLAIGPSVSKTRLRGDGSFSFERLAPGDYEVFLTVGNRRMAGVPVTVKARGKTDCRIPLLRPLPCILAPER